MGIEQIMCVQMKPTKKRARSDMDNGGISTSCQPENSNKRLAQDTSIVACRRSPFEYLMQLTKGTSIPPLSSKDFHKYSEEEADSYTMDVAMAVRTMNLEKLKAMQSQGQLFQCSNRFGESLIHIACRRGSLEIAKFFIEEGNVSIVCKDDFGRTPLHDACWTAEPNFDLMNFLIKLCPSLLFVTDKRGHSPLHYTRREHWPLWNSFLEQHHDLIAKTSQS